MQNFVARVISCVLLFLSLSCCFADDSDRFLVIVDGLYGFINSKGRMIISPQFLQAYPFSEGIAAVKKNGVWGFIDVSGDFLIEPVFTNARSFSEGFASVRLTNNYGNAVDSKGHLITDIQIAGVTIFGYNRAFAYRTSATSSIKFALMNNNGEFLTDFIFEHSRLAGYGIGTDVIQYTPYKFQEERIPVCIDSKYAYIDVDGNFITEPIFDYVEYFHHGLAKVGINGYYGIIDKTGSFAANPIFDDIKVILDSYIAVKKDGKFAFIDRNGAFVTPFIYDYAESFYMNRGLVALSDAHGDLKYGYINKEGILVVPMIYSRAYTFDNDGYAIVEGGNKSGIIDDDGYAILPMTSGIKLDSREGYNSEDVSFYHDYIIDNTIIYRDLAINKMGFMSIDGNRLTEPLFFYVEHFSSGIAKVMTGDNYGELKTGYIDDTGEYIWEPTR